MDEEKLSLLSLSLGEKMSAFNLFKEQKITDFDYLQMKKEQLAEEQYASKKGIEPEIDNALEMQIEEYETKKEMQEIYPKVRFGFDVEFDIYHPISEIGIVIMEKDGLVEIMDKQINIKDYWSEMERRETIINKYIQKILGMDNLDVFEVKR